jgi:hypothetical protein
VTTHSGPLAWPWAADTPLDRARRLALTYRAALATSAPDAAARIDAWARDHGQAWVDPIDWLPGDDELLTLAEVAHLCAVQIRTVYTWHQRGLRYTNTPDGARVRGADLIAFEQTRRQRRKTP